MGTFMFSMRPDDEGKIECIAMESGQQIKFTITEIDLARMLRSVQMWKAEIWIEGEDKP